MRKIRKIVVEKTDIQRRKKVCAYARVSEEKGNTYNSLSQQVSYFSELIQANAQWEYVGVYADFGISGTSTKRDEFQRMLKDCDEGKIDLILTKSISRFARNTVDLLEIVRDLKDKGIEVYFQKKKIYSLSEDGELMLSLLASFAQEESRSISENVKWGIRKNFEKGIGNSYILYGYRWDGEQFNVVEEEAEVVRYCFKNYLANKSPKTIAKELAKQEVKGLSGKPLSVASVRAILRQEKYTGNSLLQKTYKSDHIHQKLLRNQGELPRYWVENTHPKIIEPDVFEAVQEEIARRRDLGVFAYKTINTTCFTSKIHCSCGLNFQRESRNQAGRKYVVWACASRKDRHKKNCANPGIPEYILKNICAKMLKMDTFDETTFLERIAEINVLEPGLLEFVFKDGSKQKTKWKSTAYQDAWTEERKLDNAKRHSSPEFNRNIERFNNLTSFIKCEKCGQSYRRDTGKRKRETPRIYYRCSTPASQCKNTTINLSVIEALVTKGLGLETYDEQAMIETLDRLTVKDNQLTLHFKSGLTKTYTYKNPRHKRPSMSQAARHKTGKASKERWREKREQKNNDHTSN